MGDLLLRGLLPRLDARIVVAITTEVSAEAARRHAAGVDGAIALARASTAALLLATITKGEERVTLQIAGGGPLGTIVADARASGEVRAYVAAPGVGAEPVRTARPARRHSLAASVGRRGVLSVIRDLGLRDRYRGDADLLTGEIDEDVEHYLRTSEQIDSALGCEALVDDAGAVAAAAGLLLQRLPGSTAAPQVREAQHALRTGRLTEALARGVTEPVELARLILAADEPLDVVDEHPLRFACPCSRGRVLDMLAGLPESEHAALLAAGVPAEVTCEFCRTRYEVGLDELREMASRPRGIA